MQSAVQKIPKHLVYEMVEGKAFYYKGYLQTLENSPNKNDIVGSSYIQSLIISNLVIFLARELSSNYQLLTNEIGLQFAKNSWRAADIAIFDKSTLAGIDQENKYISHPPKAVIEVDTKIQLSEEESTLDYVHLKTDQLLQFGVEKVIWIFTDSKKVMIATADSPWLTQDWNLAVTVMPDVEVEISELLL